MVCAEREDVVSLARPFRITGARAGAREAPDDAAEPEYDDDGEPLPPRSSSAAASPSAAAAALVLPPLVVPPRKLDGAYVLGLQVV